MIFFHLTYFNFAGLILITRVYIQKYIKMSGTFQRPSQSTMFVGRSDLGVGGSEYIRHEYMTKQGAVVKNWKRRYFSLSPDKMQIAYYKYV